MKSLISLLLLVTLVSGCQDVDKTRKPEDLIPKEKMVDVITEIALLHGARSYNKNLLEEKGIDPSRYIYEKFSIDSLQFARSNDYYAANVKQYHEIYLEVKERLELLEDQYDSIREREERRRDSIRELDTLSLDRDSLKNVRGGTLLNESPGDDRQLPIPVSRRDSIR